MSYCTEELNEFVENWVFYIIEFSKTKSMLEEDTLLMGNSINDMQYCLVRHFPKIMFSLIIKILEHDNSDFISGQIAAGPMEDLLFEHEDVIMPLIEKEAKRNLTFKKMLRGIWQNDMSQQSYQRIRDAGGDH